MTLSALAITADELRRAILCDELTLFYQPQWLADGCTLVSFEALVRWPHRQYGLMSPAFFMNVAEQNGLVPVLTERLLARACRETRNWNPFSIAINVSPAQFADPSLVEAIRSTLARESFPPTRLELEIVETGLFADVEGAAALLHELRAIGIRIALDDFGTGYSSLSLLRRMPFDKVKIDKSFVDDISSLRSASIVHAVIALARAIGLKVTAEGIETVEQQRFLKTAGCHFLQGYLLSRPLPREAAAELVVAQRAGTSLPISA